MEFRKVDPTSQELTPWIDKEMQTSKKQVNYTTLWLLILQQLKLTVCWDRYCHWAKLRFQLVSTQAHLASGSLQREKVLWENREYLNDLWSQNAVQVEERQNQETNEITEYSAKECLILQSNASGKTYTKYCESDNLEAVSLVLNGTKQKSNAWADAGSTTHQ